MEELNVSYSHNILFAELQDHKLERVENEIYKMEILKMPSQENFFKCFEKEWSAIRVAVSNNKIKYLV